MIRPAHTGVPLIDAIVMSSSVAPPAPGGDAFAQLLPMTACPCSTATSARTNVPVMTDRTPTANLGASEAAAIRTGLPQNLPLSASSEAAPEGEAGSGDQPDVPTSGETVPAPFISTSPMIAPTLPDSASVNEAVRMPAVKPSPVRATIPAGMSAPTPKSDMGHANSPISDPVAARDDSGYPRPLLHDALASLGVSNQIIAHRQLQGAPLADARYASLALEVVTANGGGQRQETDFAIDVGADPRPFSGAVAALGPHPAEARTAVSSSSALTPPDLSALVDSRAVETMRAATYLDGVMNDIMAMRWQQSGASFRLSTEMLGQVGIAIDPSPEGLLVQITARGDEAIAVVSAAQPRLHDELRAQGVRVSEHTGQSLNRQSSGEREHGAHHPATQSGDSAPDIETQPGEHDRATSYRFA
jgi:hypothetical protein